MHKQRIPDHTSGGGGGGEWPGDEANLIIAPLWVCHFLLGDVIAKEKIILCVWRGFPLVLVNEDVCTLHQPCMCKPEYNPTV